MFLPLLIFAAGIVMVSATVAKGDADVSLVVIFPVFSGSSALFLLGVVLVILSFLAGFAMLATGQVETDRHGLQPLGPERTVSAERGTKYGGVVLIGPIPIAFGSDKRIATLMLLIGVATIVAILALLLLLAQ